MYFSRVVRNHVPRVVVPFINSRLVSLYRKSVKPTDIILFLKRIKTSVHNYSWKGLTLSFFLVRIKTFWKPRNLNFYVILLNTLGLSSEIDFWRWPRSFRFSLILLTFTLNCLTIFFYLHRFGTCWSAFLRSIYRKRTLEWGVNIFLLSYGVGD